MVNMEEMDVDRIALEMLDACENPPKALQPCQEAARVVGDNFEEGSFFLAGLVEVIAGTARKFSLPPGSAEARTTLWSP